MKTFTLSVFCLLLLSSISTRRQFTLLGAEDAPPPTCSEYATHLYSENEVLFSLATPKPIDWVALIKQGGDTISAAANVKGVEMSVDCVTTIVLKTQWIDETCKKSIDVFAEDQRQILGLITGCMSCIHK